MRPPLSITSVTFVAAPPHLVATGLEGWVSATLDGRLRLDGLTLRRTRSGGRSVSYPRRLDAAGRSHPTICPLDAETRLEVEQQILAELAAQEVPL